MSSVALLIQAKGVDKILTAEEHISWCEAFTRRLCAETPWQVPFTVSGSKRRHWDMPIAPDFSDFVELAELAQSDNRNDGFINVGRPNDFKLYPTSYSSLGYSTTFMEGYKVKKSGERCSISVSSPGYTKWGACVLRNLPLICKAYHEGEVNAAWLDPEVMQRVQKLFIESFTHCLFFRFITSSFYSICSKGLSSTGEQLSENNSSLVIGPIHYFGHFKAVEILRGEPDLQPCGDGLLLHLTDDIINAEHDPDIVARIHAIRRKLMDAGFRDFEEDVNRADWGCNSSPILQNEPNELLKKELD